MFYVDAPSYSRYFFNLPLQRWNTGNNWEGQKSEYDKVMDYNGKYIVYTEWIDFTKYPELKKIDSEYHILESTSKVVSVAVGSRPMMMLCQSNDGSLESSR